MWLFALRGQIIAINDVNQYNLDTRLGNLQFSETSKL